MKVKDLIFFLQRFDDEDEVLIENGCIGVSYEAVEMVE